MQKPYQGKTSSTKYKQLKFIENQSKTSATARI